jgi:hypothetical protein
MENIFDSIRPDLTTPDWYLTVRCTNPGCRKLIAFQKSEFVGANPNLRFRISGTPSVNCPHCTTLVRFGTDQIEHKRVVVTCGGSLKH